MDSPGISITTTTTVIITSLTERAGPSVGENWPAENCFLNPAPWLASKERKLATVSFQGSGFHPPFETRPSDEPSEGMAKIYSESHLIWGRNDKQGETKPVRLVHRISGKSRPSSSFLSWARCVKWERFDLRSHLTTLVEAKKAKKAHQTGVARVVHHRFDVITKTKRFPLVPRWYSAGLSFEVWSSGFEMHGAIRCNTDVLKGPTDATGRRKEPKSFR